MYRSNILLKNRVLKLHWVKDKKEKLCLSDGSSITLFELEKLPAHSHYMNVWFIFIQAFSFLITS